MGKKEKKGEEEKEKGKKEKRIIAESREKER